MKSQFGKLVRNSDFCVICGDRKATTSEHIPPKCLYIEKPDPCFTVPACKECNSSTKLDDDYFRYVFPAVSLIGQGREVWNIKNVNKLNEKPKTKKGLANSVFLKNVNLPNGN